MSNLGVLPSAEQVISLFAVLQDAEPIATMVAGTPYDEIEDSLKQVKLVANEQESPERFNNLINVLHESLIPCLIATPYVYLSDDSWKLHSHVDFRAAKRKQLKNLEEQVKATVNAASEYDTRERLNELVTEFESILLEVFRVRIPAMPNVYLTDNYYDLVSLLEIYNSLSEKIAAAKKFEVPSRIYHYARAMVEWFFLCPVGRPLVYVSDTDWTTVNESTLRAMYRAQLLK